MTPTERPIAHKVLLVDDDGAVRDMMTVTLEHKGFDVVAATNVTEALKLITTESFDVLITDLHMPNPSDGFAVFCGNYRDAPHPTGGTYAAGQRLPRREECYGRYPSGSG
jgi:CheY-like chemotaxis protein